MKKNILLFLFFLILKVCLAQEKQQPVSILSPNAASLGIFGEIPVSYYTGTPDISVPLYELKYGSVNIPITLSYHPSLVRPNQHPGWTGLGWAFDAGGVITRKVNTNPDESKQMGPNIKDGNGKFTLYSTYYYEGHKQLDKTDWATNIDVEDGTYERDPDEFSFNFLGYSGKFYYDHKGKWEVVSEKPLKVEFSESDGIGGFGDITIPLGKSLRDAYNSIKSESDPGYITNENWNPFNNPYEGDRCNCFIKFTIIGDDGTMYEFGGIDATEFSIPYDSRNASNLVSNAWYLSKIIYNSGKTVNFNYKRYFPTCSRYYWWHAATTDLGAGNMLNSTGILYSGNINFPVYLSGISVDNIKIDFTSSNSDELGYPQKYLTQTKEFPGPNDFYGVINPIYILNSEFDRTSQNPYQWTNNLKWRKLDNIIITVDNTRIKTFNFYYSTTAGSPSKSIRLRLDRVHEYGGQSDCGSSDSWCRDYYFYYNQIEALPGYGGDYTDHWGYYNGSNSALDETVGTYSSAKEPDGTKSILGLINKIVYPTGGYSTFQFGPHRYSQCVKVARNGVEYKVGIAGGSRIEKICTYESSSSNPLVRNFYYVTGYDGDDSKSFPSSGVLNGKPEYILAFINKKSLDNQTVSYRCFSTASCMAYGYNTEGSHIGYSEVIEKRTNTGNTINNGYTKYIFTNFQSDMYIDNTNHYDNSPLYTFNFDNTTYQYCPFFELCSERGKIAFEMVYNNNNECVKQTTYGYRRDASRFDNYIRKIIYNQLPLVLEGYNYIQFPYIAALGNYTYNYYLISKTERQYDTNGENPVEITENYTYNNYDQLNSISQNQSDGITKTTNYKYVADFIDMQKNNYSNCIAKCTDDNCRNDCMISYVNFYQDLDLYYNWCYNNCSGNQTCIINCGNTVENLILSGDIKLMGEKNIMSRLIEQTQTFRNVSVDYTTDATFIKYINFKGKYLPQQQYQIKVNKPITDFTPSSIGNDYQFLRDVSYYDLKTEYDAYDTYGNLLQFHKENDMNISYLWGYNNTYPIAEAQNAAWDEIFFNGFEENTDANSNTDSRSGLYSYKVAASQYSPGKDFGKWTDSKSGSYKLSAWIKTPAAYDNAKGCLVIEVRDGDNFNTMLSWNSSATGNTNNQWKYFEKIIDLKAIANANPGKKLNVRCYVWNTDPGNYLLIDDMRFQPSASKMATYTYKPLIGMTSSTDNNGFTTYYEYDAFGRLWQIKDHKGNILKQHEYHYKE